MIWMFLFAIAFLACQNDCKSFDPQKRGYIEAKWLPGHRNFKCPIGSYVKSFDISKRKVYCEQHDTAIPDERGYGRCEWQTKCYSNVTLKKGSDKVWGISRGLSFRSSIRSNKVPKIKMFCCLGKCNRYQCKDYEKDGPMVDFRAKNNRFLNFAGWKKRQQTIKGEFCRPTCAISGCSSFDPSKRGLIQSVRGANSRTHKCPLGSVVKRFDIGCRVVYCEAHDELIGDERSRKLCEWQRKCYSDNTRGNDKINGMTRGLRYDVDKRSKIVSNIQLFCCQTDCATFRCRNFSISGDVVDSRRKNNGGLSLVKWLHQQQSIEGQYCWPTCPLGSVVTGEPSVGIPSCTGPFLGCANSAECCPELFCHPNSKICKFCKLSNQPCRINQDCCTKKCKPNNKCS